MSLAEDIAYCSEQPVDAALGLDNDDDDTADVLLSGPVGAKVSDANPLAGLTPTDVLPKTMAIPPLPGTALNVSSVLRRAVLSTDETSAIVDHLPTINAYLADAALHAANGVSLPDYLQSVHSDAHGIWPAGVGGALETVLPAELSTALAKCDETIRAHHPRLCHHGLLRM